MTISESIIIWLKRFEAEGMEKIKSIDTDALQSVSASYGLMKAPQENVKKYLSGREVHSDYYQFMARLDSGTNGDRIDNQAWFEGLTKWVSEKSREKDFPVLREGLHCTGISIASPFYMGSGDNNTAVYQMTISITYQK